MAEGRGRLQRVFGLLRRSWTQAGPASDELSLGAGLSDPADIERLREQLDDIARVRGGELAARRRAQVVAEVFLGYDRTDQRKFFEVLADEYGVDHEAVDQAMISVQAAPDATARGAAEADLRTTLRPQRDAIFRRFIGVESGLAFLVQLRADLRSLGPIDDRLRLVDEDLRTLLDQFFDLGLLTLTQITWNSPAALLEKLIEYEAVHAIASWDDLRNRLGPDRRLFAFQHPAFPDDLLIFVEVALTEGLADSIGRLLDPDLDDPDPAAADTAIFYSISNCQPGLAGVRLGDFLIKRVATELMRELSDIKYFATLSPIPGFRAWLAARLEEGTTFDGVELVEGVVPHELGDLLRTALADHTWYAVPGLVGPLEPVLRQLVAHYLLEARRGRRASDPVANFHLSNGASVERVHFLANTDPIGHERALGMMVNYRYDLEDIERNHDAYLHEGAIAASDEVRSLL
ncbi:MAG: malonyl-CoA decarboxylase family protein [Actinomycetota bacterium]|jgi:malonyl-CoA decarboxylase|nr:malonyl-CoA decarboxylase family protein [Actinomycetota bacterium]